MKKSSKKKKKNMSGKNPKVFDKTIDRSSEISSKNVENIALMNNNHEKELDAEMIEVDLDEARKKISSSNDDSNENMEEVKIIDDNNKNGGRDLSPVEDRMTKEMSVVTIDTTDKRAGHRSGSRAQHTYAAKKTVAQGMMDVALITANANQLRYLVEYQRNSPTFFVNVFLIVVSLLLQIGVGVSLIFKGRFDIQGMGKSPQARKINNYVVVGVFLITIINVFVAAFSVSASPANSLPATVQQTSP